MLTWIRNRCEISNVIIQGKQNRWCCYELELLLFSDRGLVFPLWSNLKNFGSGLISEREKSVCWRIMSRQLLRYIDKCTIRSPCPSPFLWALSALGLVPLRPAVGKETAFGTLCWSWPSCSRDSLAGSANLGSHRGTQSSCWAPQSLESSALPSQCLWDSTWSFEFTCVLDKKWAIPLGYLRFLSSFVDLFLPALCSGSLIFQVPFPSGYVPAAHSWF